MKPRGDSNVKGDTFGRTEEEMRRLRIYFGLGGAILAWNSMVWPQPPAPQRRWALVIGMDKYDSPDILPLRCAVADATVLASTLREVAGFDEDHVLLLTSAAEGSRRPTKANVIYWLDYLAGEVRPGDLFVFYFAGHGITYQGRGYLMTVDADQRTPQTIKASCLSVEEIQAALKRIPAGQVLLLIDACRSQADRGSRGTDAETALTEALADGLVVPAAQDNVTATMFACDKGQRSHEWEERGHGFFTYYLAEGLRGQAADGKGAVTLQGLEAYLGKVVPDSVKREKRQLQVPWVERSARAGEMLLVPPRGVTAVGNLEVVSFPPGARVFIDGRDAGRTPTTVSNLLVGDHEVLVALEGYGEERRRVVVEADQSNSLQVWLQKTSGSLEVKSVPSGAMVYVDGLERGVTPHTVIGLAPGEHYLRVSLPGYYDYRAAETVVPGETRTTVVNLLAVNTAEEADGFLSISSEPEGLTVYVDGRPVGRTPLLFLSVHTGSRRVELRSDEYVDWTTTVKVTSNRVEKLFHQATRAFGHLRVQTDIPDAVIAINGKDAGRTDQPVDWPHIDLGRYNVAVRWPLGEVRRTVVVTKNNPVVEEFRADQVTGAISILTTQPVSGLHINGKRIDGETPLTVEYVPIGPATVKIVHWLDDDEVLTGEQTVQVAPGRTGVATVELHRQEMGKRRPVRLVAVSGDGQQAPVQLPLPAPLVAQVVDQYEQPMRNIPIYFKVTQEPEGARSKLSESRERTDRAGQVFTELTLGNQPGVYIVTATTPRLPDQSVTFTATALPMPVPTALLIISGQGQTARIRHRIGSPLVARVVDQYGQPVRKVEVDWKITAQPQGARPRLSRTYRLTNEAGEVATSLVLGDRPGSYEVTATCKNWPTLQVTFSVTATAHVK